MSYSLADYKRAIARIQTPNGDAVGTGCLIASGYVLTCAHVVLQALGKESENFPDYQEPPTEAIQLCFPVDNINAQPLAATVVEWLPYSDTAGDVAILQLSSPEPETAKPVPLLEIDCDNCQGDRFNIFGFPQPSGRTGDWADDYKPYRSVADGRILIKKSDGSELDVIEPGYSGAPIWNATQQCVVGIIATVQIEDFRKAYAISRAVFQQLLARLSARTLSALIEAELTQRDVLEEVLRICDPNGTQEPWRDRLTALACDRGEVKGWEKEGALIRFAVILARQVKGPVYRHIREWIEQEGHDYPTLTARREAETNENLTVASLTGCDHLLVALGECEKDPRQVRISIWAVGPCDRHGLGQLAKPLVSNHDLAIEELPALIQKQRRKYSKKANPTIHLFLPRNRLNCGLEMYPYGTRKKILGSDYRFNLRTNLQSHPIDVFYQDDWEEKWEHLQSLLSGSAKDVMAVLDCSNLDSAIEAIDDGELLAAVLQGCGSIENFFTGLVEETMLPIVLWSRDPQYDAKLTDLLQPDCALETVPERVRVQRQAAKDLDDCDALGNHIGLMWEDPGILPPDWMFESD